MTRGMRNIATNWVELRLLRRGAEGGTDCNLNEMKSIFTWAATFSGGHCRLKKLNSPEFCLSLSMTMFSSHRLVILLWPPEDQIINTRFGGRLTGRNDVRHLPLAAACPSRFVGRCGAGEQDDWGGRRHVDDDDYARSNKQLKNSHKPI